MGGPLWFPSSVVSSSEKRLDEIAMSISLRFFSVSSLSQKVDSFAFLSTEPEKYPPLLVRGTFLVPLEEPPDVEGDGGFLRSWMLAGGESVFHRPDILKRGLALNLDHPCRGLVLGLVLPLASFVDGWGPLFAYWGGGGGGG